MGYIMNRKRMNRKTCTGILLTGLLLGSSMQNTAVLAEGLVDDGIVADSGSMASDDTLQGLDVGTITAVEETTADETGAAAAFIEDGNTSVKQEGDSLEEVLESERKVQEALEAAADLMVFSAPVLEQASAAQLQLYLQGLYARANPTGSNEELDIADYIKNVMSDLGYTVEEQNFHEGFLNENYVDVPGLNIIAERTADSEHPSDRILIVAAHYDSKTNPQEDDLLSNDKTGAAVLLETGRILSQIENDIDVCFVFLSGEEDGLYGSEKFVEFLSEEQKERVCGVIYVGTVGTASDAPYLLGTSDPSGSEPGRLIRAIALGAASDEDESGAGSDERSENADSTGTEGQSGNADSTDSERQNVSADGAEQDAEAGSRIEVNYASRGRGQLLLQYPYTTDTPEAWTFVTDTYSGRTHFGQTGMASVTLFQDVTGLYVDGTTPVVRAPEQTAGITADQGAETAVQSADQGSDQNQGTGVVNNSADGSEEEYWEIEYETANAAPIFYASFGEGDSGLPIDMEALQNCTNILAETVSQYMYAETAEALGLE